jgi:hypothetical protein
MRAYLLNVFAVILMGLTAHVAVCLAGTQDSGPVLALRLVDNAETPVEVLDDAMAHVERIFQAAGIRMIRTGHGQTDPLESGPGVKRLELTLVLVGKEVSNVMCPEKTVTGLALANNGQGNRRAYVFGARVIAEAERATKKVRFLNRPKAWGLILGHVIAHEAGHLMLPHGSHTSSGIMRGRLEIRDIEDAVRGEVGFSRDHVNRIRAVLMGAAG